MAKRHDENKDIRLISRIAKVNFADKTISAPKNVEIGNRRWGRIDYLCHYCGWTLVHNNRIVESPKSTDNEKTKKEKAELKRRKSKAHSNAERKSNFKRKR